MPNRPLPPPASHYLLAAQGWLELGDSESAGSELAAIGVEHHGHPDFIEVSWHLEARHRNWERCIEMAEQLIQAAPERVDGWIHLSFALHELHRTTDAFEKLLTVVDRFPNVWTIPYNLACYCAQMGRLDEAREWYEKAAAQDRAAVESASESDNDLDPIRSWILSKKQTRKDEL